MGAVEHR